MAFIRVKTRKSNGSTVEYAYLVSNSWRKRKRMAKQSVKGYLGRVYRFSSNGEFQVEDNGYENELRRFVEFTLLDAGFKAEKRHFVKDNLIVDLYKRSVYTVAGKKAVVGLNDGFVCDWTLKQLFSIKLLGSVDAELLAKSLRLTGLNVTPSNFVKLYQLGVVSG